MLSPAGGGVYPTGPQPHKAPHHFHAVVGPAVPHGSQGAQEREHDRLGVPPATNQEAHANQPLIGRLPQVVIDDRPEPGVGEELQPALTPLACSPPHRTLSLGLPRWGRRVHGNPTFWRSSLCMPAAGGGKGLEWTTGSQTRWPSLVRPTPGRLPGPLPSSHGAGTENRPLFSHHAGRTGHADPGRTGGWPQRSSQNSSLVPRYLLGCENSMVGK